MKTINILVALAWADVFNTLIVSLNDYAGINVGDVFYDLDWVAYTSLSILGLVMYYTDKKK